MADLQHMGAMPPPLGVTPDFDLSHNPLRAVYTTALVFMLVFPALAVPMRVYTKITVIKTFKFADVACVVGFVGFLTSMTCAMCRLILWLDQLCCLDWSGLRLSGPWNGKTCLEHSCPNLLQTS